MKHIKPMVIIMAAFLGMSLSSCRFTVDTQIDAFEESIELLDENYKDLTPAELEKALNLCEKQLSALQNSEVEFTPNQKERISNLTGRYHRLLLKIEFYMMTHDLFDGEDVIEYLKGLIAGGE